LPQPWLAKTMKKKFSGLCEWTEELRITIFGASVTLRDAFLTGPEHAEDDMHPSTKTHLPWKPRNTGGAVGVGSMFLSSLTDTIPLVGQFRRNTRMRQHGGKIHEDEAQSSSWKYAGLVGSVIASLGLVAGYMFHEGLLPYASPEEDQKKEGLGAFGEAGEALSFFATAMDADAERQRRMENSTGAYGEPVMEVGVESNRGTVNISDSIT